MAVIVVIITPPDVSLTFAGSVSWVLGRAVLCAENYGLKNYWIALSSIALTKFLLTGFEKHLISLFLNDLSGYKIWYNKEAAHHLKAMRRFDDRVTVFL